MAKKPRQDETAAGTKQPGVTRIVERPETFGSYYANETQVQTGPWDVRLVFSVSEIEETEGVRTARVKQQAEVRMSHQHAVTILEIISTQLRGFEEKFGKIPVPKATGD